MMNGRAGKMLALFEGHNDETIDAFLIRLRPTPLDEDSRAKVIASLPKDGEVRPSRKDGEKLSAAQRILDYSARATGVTIKVIDVDSAFVGLYHRAGARFGESPGAPQRRRTRRADGSRDGA